MRIARLELTGIGPFEGAVFAIPEPRGTGELVLFEGPNGSGKTTVVEAIAVAIAQFTRASLGAPNGRLEQRFRSAEGAMDLVLAHQAQTLHYRCMRDGVSQVFVQAAGIGALLGLGMGDRTQRLGWAAFAFGGHQDTAALATEGPKDIAASPLDGALSFGRGARASDHLGQFLTNLENERTKALTYARDKPDPQRSEALERLAASRRDAIARFERALSDALEQRVSVEFSIDRQAPQIRLDGEDIPLDLLGEGKRSTLSWLSNLLVRLERVPWEDTIRSPLDQDFWLILDEIDESLHPTMQARIYPALRELFPNARIYATTHSPFVVASVGEGTIFPIRPDRDHKVRGEVEAHTLRPGQSLELVTTDIFQAPAGFVDQQTRDDLNAHDRDVQSLQRKNEIDWSAFLARRDRLMQLNDEVRTIVAMQEAPVQKDVLRRLRERIAEKEREARP
jgi:hypothetical protein